MKELFTPPQQESIEEITTLYKAIRTVMPLKRNQYNMLPRAIQELSSILTQHRGEMPFYWSSPALLSAYFYYFMPWNLVRLAQVLPNIDLPTPSYFEKHPSILDIGSGTLTIPLALWLYRKELRNIPLTIYCYDTAKNPMVYGKRLLEAIMPSSEWKIILIDARKSHYKSIKTKVALTVASNVANELVQRKTSCIEDTLTHFYTMLTSHLEENGQALCIEIGTRLGGTIISTLHDIVLQEEEYSILAPCTHQSMCPYSTEKASTWCHFSFADFIAPQWLTTLSQRAYLPKTTLSTSLLHIGTKKEAIYNSRVLSAPIYIPTTKEHVRYVCREEGIAVLENAKRYVQGTALNTTTITPQRIDEKTGYPFVSCVQQKSYHSKSKDKQRLFR